ncbi:MAG: hypothetical protein HKL87_03365 [Acidimicrobiaceae bacterium]|nr:hypothetical protein [Acidimicrobiaceae bacterium]
MSALPVTSSAEVAAATAWSRRVRRVGGFIQVAFATFWLVRGSLTLRGVTGEVLAAFFLVLALWVTLYGVRVTAGRAPRPTSVEGRHIEREVTVATIIQLVASFAVPVVVIALGYPDWVLPSIAITIGPLLLWLDYRVHIPRLSPVGWVLIGGSIVLGLVLSGNPLAVTTGLSAGALLLATATLGFHDLTRPQVWGLPRRPRHASSRT